MSRSIRTMFALAMVVCWAPGVRGATIVPLDTFGDGDGVLAPGDRAYLTTDNTQRGLAYNPVTGNLLLVNRAGGLSVHILDGMTGADLGTLDLTGVTGGLFTGNMIDVAADGAIYLANLTTDAPTNGNFKVYRWEDEASVPTVAFDGAPLPGARMGDSFAVFGSGANTKMAAGYNATPVVTGINSFSYFSTTDGLNFTGTHVDVPTTPPNNGDFRLGITFQDADTVIGRQSAAPANPYARIVDVAGSSGTLVASYTTEGNANIGVDYATVDGKPLIGLVNTADSRVFIYDITPPFDEVLANPNIAVGNAIAASNANVNGTGQVTFGAISGNEAIVYALNTNNGIQAYRLTLDAGPAADADFDDDGDVDGQDFLTWQANTGGAGDAMTGDATGDGQVNDADFAAWRAAFGQAPMQAAAASVVPEPTSATVALLLAAAGVMRRRRVAV